MINYETILSLFDDKLTLLEYLTKIQKALENEQLTSINVTQTDATHVYFTFVFEDSTTIDTPTFTLPAGPQGIQGPAGTDGISVTGVTIDASNHLILTLSNGNTIDAGKVAVSNNVVELSGLSGTLTDEQYSLLQANGSKILRSERYFEKVYEDSTSIYFEIINFAWNDTYRYRIVITKSTKAWSFASHSAIIPSTGIYAQGVTTGKVLTVDNGASKWADPTGLTSVKASDVNSETATNGQVLTADGSGGASWAWAGGGTTLTKYTFDSSTDGNANWLVVRKILNNAKGKITGYIEFTAAITGIGIQNLYMPINLVYVKSNYLYACNVWKTTYSRNIAWYLSFVWTGGACTKTINAIRLDTNAVETVANPAFSTVHIEYYNDEEITQ